VIFHNRELCKTAEPTEMSSGMWTQVGPRNHYKMGQHCRSPNMKGQFLAQKGAGQDMTGYVRQLIPYTQSNSAGEASYSADDDWAALDVVQPGEYD